MKKFLEIFKFKRKKNFAKRRGGLLMNINFYWKLSITIVFIIFVIFVFVGYDLFMKNSANSELVAGSIESQVRTIKKERIDNVLQYFSSKEKKSNNIISSPSPVVDPSL